MFRFDSINMFKCLLGKSCLFATTTTGTPVISELHRTLKSSFRDSSILSLSLQSTIYIRPGDEITGLLCLHCAGKL